MNFQELYKKIKQLDEQDQAIGVADETPPPAPQEMPPSPMDAGLDASTIEAESSMEECGGDMMPRPMSAPKQSDSVTMSVSMNGSGQGGIRDLLNVLKDIEGGADDHSDSDDAIFGKAGEVDLTGEPLLGDEYANSAENTVTLDIDAVTPTGDDLHSKGREAEKVNGGGNPFNVDESLVARLSDLYKTIKES